jgi:hypothetical protein
MDEGGSHNSVKSALTLMKEFTGCVKKLERARKAKMRRSLFLSAFSLTPRTPEIREKQRKTTMALTRRYKGVLWELFRRAGTNEERYQKQ